MASVPLLVKNKKIGVLNCYTEKPHHFTEEEISVLTALGNHAAIAIEHAKLMVKSAHHPGDAPPGQEQPAAGRVPAAPADALRRASAASSRC